MDKPPMAGSTGKSKNCIQDACRRIKRMIFDQKLVPGQKLVYADLARTLEMSQTPVINALNRLEQDGFVASEVFRGFYVRPIDLREIRDNFGVRQALETHAVRQAIESGDRRGLRLLEEKLEQYAACQPERYTRRKFALDAEFHLQIADMANNRVLKLLLKSNLEHVYLRGRLDDYQPERMKTALAEHRKLLEKIKNKDIKAGIEVIQKHITTARDCVIRCLASQEENLDSGRIVTL